MWPLFVFIILVVLQTAAKNIHNTQCNFIERSLPSAGLMPFMRSYVCGLISGCSSKIYDSTEFNQKFYKLTQISSDYLGLANEPSIIEKFNTVNDAVQLTIQVREETVKITRRIKLRDVLRVDEVDFEELLNKMLNNDTIVQLIMDSNPNFNNLYSNFSKTYEEPLLQYMDQKNSTLSNALVNILYGPDLDLIDYYRDTNDVSDPVWIKKQMCFNNTNYLLKGLDQVSLSGYLCSQLSDARLTDLFVLISEQLDFTATKQKVLFEISIKPNFIDNVIKVLFVNGYKSLFQLQNEFLKLDTLAKNDVTTKNLIDQYNDINEFGLCKHDNQSIKLTLSTLFTSQSDSKNENSNSSSNNTEQLNNCYSKTNKSNTTVLSLADQLTFDSTTKNCYCKNLYTNLESSEKGRVLLSLYKPVLIGKILYHPNTPEINELIQKANKTFQNIAELNALSAKISKLLFQTVDLLNTSKNIDLIKSNLNIFSKQDNLSMLANISVENIFIETKSIAAQLALISDLVQCFEVNRFIGFESEEQLLGISGQLSVTKSFLAAVLFENVTNGSLPDIVTYKIRMSTAYMRDEGTKKARDAKYAFGVSDNWNSNKYFTFGFIYIQDMIEKAIIEMKTNQTQDFGIIAQMFPYPCYVSNMFLSIISANLTLLMIISSIYTISMTVKDIVNEKEKRLKEFMRVMGLKNITHWIAWFISSFVLQFAVAFILCLIIKYGNIIKFTNFIILVFFFFCFTLASISLCFLLSVCFDKANLASVMSGIIYFLLYLPHFMVNSYSETIQPWLRFLLSLSTVTAFGNGIEVINYFESIKVGAQFNNFYSSPQDNNFSLNTVCLILLLDALIYMILALYIENVFPGEYGIAKPWYYPIFYFLPKKNCLNKSDYINGIEKTKPYDLNDLIEPVTDLKPGVEITNLHKIYSRGKKHALKGLSVKFYENEIASFLGHNGAGKSSTMHILTGLYTPTEGTAKINGLDITKSMDDIRKSIGFVPQHNILFPLLSVKEHLWFYSRLKGVGFGATFTETNQMLEDTGLASKRNELSQNLSGGMQRKLSIAIAFVGNSKTVILDEPSAGVDAHGRRCIWDLLFKYRQNRTIIISTHHMDEAEILGDRIAIISNGELKAHGSTYFLKNKFGNRFYLHLAKIKLNEEDVDQTDQMSLASGIETNTKTLKLRNTLINFRKTKESEDELDSVSITPSVQSTDSGISTASSCASHNSRNKIELKSCKPFNQFNLDKLNEYEEDEDLTAEELDELKRQNLALDSLTSVQVLTIHKFIKKRFKSAILVENIGCKMSYSISNTLGPNYERNFNNLEQNLTKLGINSMGISAISLEEIFIRLTNEESTLKKQITQEQLNTYSTYTKKRLTNEFCLIKQQFFALLIKRFHRTRRNLKGFFAEMIVPLLFIMAGLLISFLKPIRDNDFPPVELHPWYYNKPNTIFLSKSSALDYERTFYYDKSFTSETNKKSQPNMNSVSQITDTFFRAESLGNRCIEGHRIPITEQSIDTDDKMKPFYECELFSYSLINNPQSPSDQFISNLKMTNYSFSKISLNCECPDDKLVCPLGSGGDIEYRKKFNLKTKDILLDVTSRNITDWLVKTEFKDDYFLKRYGGFEFLVPISSDKYQDNSKIFYNLNNVINNLTQLFNITYNWNQIAESIQLISNQNVKIWYNFKGYDSSVSYLNVINNAFLRSKMNQSAIVAYNHPMKSSEVLVVSKIVENLYFELFISICVIFGLSLIPASFLVFLLEERQTNAKQLQYVSGVKPYIYWLSNFTWDLFNYINTCLVCLIFFLIFNIQAYVCASNFAGLVSLILLYGWACIPLMYLLNYLFKEPSTAFVLSSTLNFFIGIVSTVSTTILLELSGAYPFLGDIEKTVETVFIILFPHYCLGQGFLQMSILYNVALYKSKFGIESGYNIFDFNNLGRNLVALFVQGGLYLTLNLLLEYKFFIRSTPIKDVKKLNLPKAVTEDEDVLNEKKRILSKKNRTDYIRLVNLTKIYKKYNKCQAKKHVAVNRLTLGIKKGECFGLIGVNGAGKTTTFKMITGEIKITGGDVFVNGLSVSKQTESVYKNIGYCPQFDALLPLLTAREHLILFARLRGIPEKYVKEVTIWALNRVGLQNFADKISADYSGGNKRKLSTAIALIGDPSVICLDEPTAGMDAKARRLLWNDILSLVKEDRCVVLTSHSLEECEALCTRLVIMVDGKFKCLGSPQHLKLKFGCGYILSIKLINELNKEDLFKFMKENFLNYTVKDMQRNLFEFLIPYESTRLSHLFGKLESNREVLNIKDYSINQSTLDQIFVNFAQNCLNENNDSKSIGHCSMKSKDTVETFDDVLI